MDIINALKDEFKLQLWQVENVVKLLEEGNTVPFIARYRKEAHGTLNDQVIRQLSEKLEYLKNLEKRREEVRNLISGQDKLTDEISLSLDRAKTISEIDDIYRPFRPKKKTRASVAKEKGLEPLADAIFAQKKDSPAPLEMAAEFIDTEKGVPDAEAALQGAMDIIAENVSDDPEIRRRLRGLFTSFGIINVVAADNDAENVYTNYYDFSEPVSKIAGHRVLAIDRGEKEGFLKVSVTLDPLKAANVINLVILKSNGSPCNETVRLAGSDAYNRLIYPSIEREIRKMLTDTAAENAIKVFALNTKELLLQSPVKGKTVIGLDPGYRTGCKVAVVDKTGKVLDTGVIYVTHSEAQKEQAKHILKRFISMYSADCISIGNGTASKETEIFVSELLREISADVSYLVVSEAGASVYSASELAAKEFPQYDVALRSAVSIARRLQDPLAELVKIDPKAIGVGQYQHDMPKKELDAALDAVIEDAVNSVGVDLNTASMPLLSRVSGINSTTAKNIVGYREENGEFRKRSDLKKVPKLGPKAFEQCAGFLRVSESAEKLDNTGVHPESYTAAEKLLNLFSYTKDDIGSEDIKSIGAKVTLAGEETVAQKLDIGVPTLRDIIKELISPCRDPRDELPPPLLRTDVMEIKDLKPGMEMKGTVRNVTDFGAFVDISVHQDGLVHISQITNRFIKHPSEVLKVGQVITVWVLSVDIKKQRISLTMIPERGAAAAGSES
ncbi:MAG: RNA-binding transcriptional accessory protein [Clostridiales bacterium]|nr:RNA-binding transcriptional accessory protein [Clostridiales bacterium]